MDFPHPTVGDRLLDLPSAAEMDRLLGEIETESFVFCLLVFTLINAKCPGLVGQIVSPLYCHMWILIMRYFQLGKNSI